MSIWSWLAGFTSVATIFLMGRKYWWAPIFGLVCQSFWFIYVFTDKQYGLLICVVAYAIVHLINSIKWVKERKELCPK